MKYVRETKVTVYMFGLVGAVLMLFASHKESELRKQQDIEKVAVKCDKNNNISQCSKRI